MGADTVKAFILKVVLWLPAVFGAWYYMASLLTWPIKSLMHLWVPDLFPEVIAAVEQSGHFLHVVLESMPAQAAGGVPDAAPTRAAFQVNPLIYGYSMPLYTALLLASPGSENQKLMRWGTGMLILLPIQAWGVFFDILSKLLFFLGPEIAAAMAFSPAERELSALGYQFGYLILPAVAPLVIWLGLHRDFVATLVPGLAPES